MSSLDIFVLKWEFDSSEHYFFQGAPGQTEKDFNVACMQLIDTAVANAVKTAKASMEEPYVGWNDIVLELAKLLPTAGFYEFKPATVIFDGAPVISDESEMAVGFLSKESKKSILEYNQSLDKKYAPQMSSELGEVYEVDEDDETD